MKHSAQPWIGQEVAEDDVFQQLRCIRKGDKGPAIAAVYPIPGEAEGNFKLILHAAAVFATMKEAAKVVRQYLDNLQCEGILTPPEQLREEIDETNITLGIMESLIREVEG